MTTPPPAQRATFQRIWDEAAEANANGTATWHDGLDVPDVDPDGGWTPNELDRLADDRAGWNYSNGRP